MERKNFQEKIEKEYKLQIDELVKKNKDLEKFNKVLLEELEMNKKREGELKKSEQFLNNIINAIDDPVFVKDEQHRWILVNDKMCDLVGFPREELLGKSDYDFLPKEEADVFWEKDSLVLKTGITNINEEKITFHNKFILTLSTKKSLLIDPVSGKKFIVAIIRDITEEKAIESNLLYRFAIEELITSISTAFLKISNLEVDKEINKALEKIGKFLKADTCYIILLKKGAIVSGGYEWSVDGIRTVIDVVLGKSMEDFPWIKNKAEQFETIYVPNVSEMTEDAKPERELFQSRNIKTLLCFPLMREKSLYGVMGLSAKSSEKVWKKEDIRLIRLLSEIIVTVIERKEREIALSESETRYRELADFLPQPVFETGPDGIFTFANKSAFETFGYTDEDFKRGISSFDIISLEDIKRAQENNKKRIAGEPVGFCEYKCRRKDGTTLPVLMDAIPIIKDSKLVGLRGIAMDITERKKVEEERERLAIAVEQARESVVITDGEGYIQYVNPAFEKTTGYLNREVIGKNPRILKSGRHDEEFFRNLWHTIKSGKVWYGQLINKKKNGKFYYTEASISPIKNQEGNITNYVSVRRDVTEKIEMEKQLRQSQKLEALGTMAGGIAHNFNNILAAIIGFVQLSLLDLPKNSKISKNLQEVVRASHRARDMIKQILAFSRQSEDKKILMKITPVVEEALNLVKGSLPSSIELNTNLEAPSASIMGEASQIHQIVLNLCSNSAHSMKETGGVLEVSLCNIQINVDNKAVYQNLKPGRYIRLTVKDTGYGMTPEILERVFEPYFTTKGPEEGTGMGLAVVHGVVDHYNGVIKVESALHEGTSFHIYFPEAESPLKENILEPQPLLRGKERIFFVDDEVELSIMVKLMLEKLGYEVMRENSSIKALEIFKENSGKFDLVITDHTMPDMTGKILAGEFLKIRPDIPVILCSGFSQLIDLNKIRKIGIKDFLVKPFNIEELAGMVRKVLDS